MSSDNWEQTLGDLKQETASIKGRAEMFLVKFEEMRRRAESFKIAFLNYQLERQRRSLARRRGYTSIMRDGKRLRASLGAAGVGLILAGIISKDKFAAVDAGLSSFDAALRGLGDTAWAVSEDLRLVVPKADITTGKTWVTWESLKSALAQLEREASQRVALGSLDSIISRLKRRREVVYLGLSEAKPTWLKVTEP